MTEGGRGRAELLILAHRRPTEPQTEHAEKHLSGAAPLLLTFCFPTMLSKGSSGLQDASLKVALLARRSAEPAASFMMSSGSVSRFSSGCWIRKVSMLWRRRKSLRSFP